MGKDQELLEAARNGNIELVSKILTHKAKRSIGPLSSFRRNKNVNYQDMNGYTALHHACLNGHSGIVRLLLAHDDSMTDTPDIRGSTPLYLAAWAGHQDIVKMLLMQPHRPANPNAQTIENETPLHCAAQHGHNTALAILLAYGADPNIRNNSFQTALDLAAQFGRLQAVQLLIRTHPELIEPYKKQHAHAESAQKVCPLVTRKTPTKHIFTHTCLHLASRNGHKKVVETLLAAGVDANILTHAGSALHEAALCGKKSVVCTLLKAGVDVQAIDGSGRTALDILKDFPPHVTYEIVTVINDFCKQKQQQVNGGAYHFKPIPEHENEHNSAFSLEEPVMRNKSHSMPKSAHDRRKKLIQNETSSTAAVSLPKNNLQTNRFSISMSSLEKSTKRPTERYLLMKPITWQKSTQNIGAKQQNTLIFKPIIQPLAVKKEPAKTPPRKLSTDSYEFVALPTFYKEPTTSTESLNCEKTSIKRYHCVDEYVQMTEPTNSTATATITSPSLSSTSPYVSLTNINTQTTQKAPLPSPRSPRNSALGDYANINSISPKFTITVHTAFIDANNNSNKQHSPTPEFPPPSVIEAERTILGFMQPLSKKNKRRSIQLQDNENKDLESFIMEHINKFESSESPHSSRISDCVEEFVADKPFAGLFKGSALNLYSDDKLETNPLEQQPPCLRSPSLVRSIKPIPATRRKQFTALPHQTQKQQEKLVAPDMNEAQVWDEINSILQTIDKEVLNADKAEHSVNKNKATAAKQNPQSPTASSTMEKVHLRTPADLRLGITNDTATTNWCHSPNTLIYGQIMYTVYYLGSTIIKELHGEASTRKSIQKLKRDDNVTLEKEFEVSLLDDCNNSTKYLKTSNQKQRLKVDIVISHNSVKFIDNTNKRNICIHAIENINCVSQDAEDMRYFAYITREQDIHYCHVFMVDSLEMAKEIILTLGQTFEVAYQLALNKQKSPLLEAENEQEDCNFNSCAMPAN